MLCEMATGFFIHKKCLNSQAMATFSFKKAERLKSRKVIEQMFREGKSFGVYPLRLVFLKIEEPQNDAPVQFTVSVSKKKFKTAVARNRVKRKVREAWRLNKNWLYEKMGNKEGQYAFMVIYTGKEDLPYRQIDRAIKTINRLFLKKTLPGPPTKTKQKSHFPEK